MNDRVDKLVELLRVERLEHDLFRGISQDIGSPILFGGQVLGQALMSAAMTVDEARSVHSLHAYFLRPGDKTARIVYEVERIRDGGSFTTRRVVAVQHGQPIFNFSASFQVPEVGVHHCQPMPQVVGPEGLASDQDLRRRIAEHLPEARRAAVMVGIAVEIRPVDPVDLLAPAVGPPVAHAWLRAPSPLPDDPVLHQAMLAYASDFGLLRSALNPHGLSYLQSRLQVASLDHAMWFHDSFRMDDWLLYSMDSPAAGGARGFCRGSVYTQDARLVASVAQEGLIRVREPKNPDSR
ncbi:MAG: acyl-CoA thioesterase II [Burkholderiaceae bacterium]